MLGRDIHIAIRLLRRSPLITFTAFISIAISVGATAVVFAAVKVVLLNPLPYAHVERLVQLRGDHDLAGPSHNDWLLWNDAREIIHRTRTLESIGVYSNAVFDLGGNSSAPPEALYGLRVSASAFPTLGVYPMIGRNILPEEDQPSHAEEMIVSYGLWSRRFNCDRSIVGKRIAVNRRPCLVIGVMPPDFDFPLRRGATRSPQPYVEFWAPLRTGGPIKRTEGVGAVARLRPGVSLAEAQQDLASINAVLKREFPSINGDRTLHLAFLRERIVGRVRPALWLLLTAAVMFLLVGCANIANLLLARGVARQREISIRMAVGASGSRIIAQLLTESCILGTLGGFGGYLMSVAVWKILPAIVPVSIPRLSAARADWTVLAFACAIALANGVLFGIAPALRAARLGASFGNGDLTARGAGAGKQHRLRASLVMAEVAISVVLVLTGSQVLGSFMGLIRSDPGFQADRVLASILLPQPGTLEKKASIYKRFLNAARSVAGVQNAGVVDALPFSGENHGGYVSATAATAPERQVIAEINLVGGDYLQALGVKLFQGRWFREEEAESSETAIINDALANRLWPGKSAIGQRICLNCTPENPARWKSVIGVVSGVRHAALDGPAPLNVYVSAGAFQQAAFLVVRTDRPTGEIDKAIRRAIARIDPNQPVLLSASLRTLIDDSVADRRFVMTLLVITSFLALLMASGGIYGVASYTTSRRTQEIGIRMALGATPGGVQAFIFRHGFLSVGAGFMFGLCLTAMLMPALRSLLPSFEVKMTQDLWLSACLVLLTAAAACWIPARRATAIDPMLALRED